MLKSSVALVCCCVALAATSVAAPIKEIGRDAPTRYLPSWDGRLASVELTDGSAWNVWSYRNGAEYDLALAFRSPDGDWAPTEFIGEADGSDQLQPQAIADAAGHLYVTWVDRRGNLSLAIRSAVGTGWSPATVIAEGQRLATPTMGIVGDRLVIAYRDGAGVSMVDLPLLQTLVLQGAFGQHGLHDVPDPVTRENPYDRTGKEDEDRPHTEEESDENPYTVGPD